MHIDWVTVAAQIVNFLVLVWLLKRFLYGPITRAMEKREQRIAERIQLAEEGQEAAAAERALLHKHQRELEEQREGFLAKAQQEAQALRHQLNVAAREDVAEMKRAWRLQIEEERAAFTRDLRAQATRHFYELSRAAFRDLADSDVSNRIAVVFARQLRALGQEERDQLRQAAEKADSKIEINAPFELSLGVQKILNTAISEIISGPVQVNYNFSSEFACGLRLEAGSRTIEWSIETYLDGLTDQLSKTFIDTDNSIQSRRPHAPINRVAG